MRILSGIQPSGALHIGNYFGALKQFIDLQQANNAYYFVADYHALTSVRDAAALRAFTFDVYVTMLALGLDPEKATLFVQSDVPETTELAWLLSTVTPMGWLEKCVSYKDKVEQGLSAEHGLFAYPLLQAADILLYDADLVPVGQDQKQHLEITRDIAERFNRVYGGGQDVFRLPKPHILESVAVIPGLDGRKMSKSYNNTIDIFDDPTTVRKKAKKIVTDSTPVEAPKNPETCPLFALYKLFAAPDELRGGREALSRRRHRLRRSQDPSCRGHHHPVWPRQGTACRLGGASRTRRRSPRRRRHSSQDHGPQGPRPRPCGMWSRLTSSRRHVRFSRSILPAPPVSFWNTAGVIIFSHSRDRAACSAAPCTETFCA